MAGGINLGDATFHFLGDLTGLDAALARIESDTAAKLQPAADAATAVSKGFDQVTTSAVAAGEALKATSASTVQAASNAQTLANKLIAEGVSAKDTTAALVNLGFAHKEAAAAAALAAEASSKQATAVADLGSSLNTIAQKATVAGTAGANAGKSLSEAFRLVQSPVKQSDAALQNMAFSLRNVAVGGKVAGEEVEKGGHKATEALQKGVATAGLLSEATGITLPRHVRTFIAELPALGAALEAAFNVAAIFFVIEAIVAAGEKIEEFLEKPRKIAEAMRDVEDAAILADRSLSEAFNASKAEEIGIIQGSIAKLDFELNHLAGSAQKVAGEIGTIGEALVKSLELQQTSKFDLLSFFLPNSREVTEEAKHFVTELQSTLNRSGNQAGLKLLEDKLGEVSKEMRKTAEEFQTQAEKIGSAFDLIDHGNQNAAGIAKTRLVLLGQLTDALREQQKVILDGIRLDEQQTKDLQLSRDKAALQQQIAIGEARIESASKLGNALTDIELQQARLRNALLKVSYLEDARAEAEAAEKKYQNTLTVLQQQRGLLAREEQQNLDQLAAVRGKEPKQIADNDTQKLNIKNEYAAKVIEIDGKIVEAEKEHQARQLKNDADFEHARQELRLENQELLKKDLAKQLETGVLYPTAKVQEFTQATDQLTQAQLRLAESQARLAQTKITQDFGPQEAAITALADFGIITEQRKSDRLRTLYKGEEDAALTVLNNLALAQKSAFDAAQVNLAKKQSIVGISPQELDEAQRALDQALAAEQKTQADILNTKIDFAAKGLAVQRLNVAEAVAIARSEGKDMEAAQILEAQTKLDNANATLALARARGVDVKASQEEVKAAQKVIDLLVKGASAGKAHSRAIVEWSETGKQAFRDFEASIATAAAAVVSGQLTMGKAIEAAILGVISHLAQQWADYYAALAIAAAAGGDWGAAAGYAAAAAALEVVAGVASGLASKISQGAQNSSAATGGSGSQQAPSAAETVQQQPVQSTNVQHLAGGGLFSGQMPRLAIVGDTREAVVPLGNDSDALDEIAGRIHELMGGGSGGVTHVYNIKGDVIDHKNLMRQQSRAAKKGQGRLTVNNSYRVTRRG